MDTKEFNKLIAPFFWREHNNNFSVCLNAGDYKQEIFAKREEDGFEGNGYDWCSLANVFLKEYEPQLNNYINYDPEAGMYCAYSDNPEALKRFVINFKKACENDYIIYDLLSRAEID